MANTPKIGIPYDRFAPFLSTAASVYVANSVPTILFEVPGFSVTINNVLWRLNTPQVGSDVGFGIYAVTPGSLTRGVRLADTGAVSAAAGTLMTTPFSFPVTLPPGWYCMAFTTNNGAVAIDSVLPGGAFATGMNVFNQTPEGFLGTAANAGVGGQLPNLLGLITLIGATKFPSIMLSN